MNTLRIGSWGLGLLAAVAVAYAGGPSVFDLSWHTVDNGGGMRDASRHFEMSGTIGQPDAGRMSGVSFSLTGGFWFEVVPGDCTEDGGVTLFDNTQLPDCSTGPGGTAGENCLCLDMDGDRDVDLADVAAYQESFTTP